MPLSRLRRLVGAAIVLAAATLGAADKPGLQISDLPKLRSVADVHLSPDTARIAYAVINSDRPGRPYPQVWVMDVATRRSTRLGSQDATATSPRWSHDGRSIAYLGSDGERFGLMVASADGSHGRLIAPVAGTNAPLPTTGAMLTWSPDDRQIAFVSSTPGPEQAANGDPMVITRYLYKPTASEGLTRFNDNRRLHIFLADVATGHVRQLTDGAWYEHSIDWSPSGDRILFVSNHEADPDRVFNYDLFTVSAATGDVAQLTHTKSAEYDPVWSPDGNAIAYLGTTRELTSSETTMEDTHVWVMKADGSDRREIGRGIDDRQRPPQWMGNDSIGTLVEQRGVQRLYEVGLKADGTREFQPTNRSGSISSWSTAAGRTAYAVAAKEAPADLFIGDRSGLARLTTLNDDLLRQRTIAPVESFTFRSFDGTEIEAFLTRPAEVRAGAKVPLIVMMHGGPHGQQGPAFNAKAQIYAAHGFATLMVNYRGSTGYGQKLADAIFGDQDGGEAKDVLAGVDAALRRDASLDASRMGLEGVSYGGQLTNWIVTQTDRFKAAIPISGISNLVTQNYLSYYHDYLAVEFGAYPHEKGINDRLWERSPIRYVAKVKTPVLFAHGENDNDVPIAEAEQFYIALKDVGVETVMLRYAHEGHGITEVAHTQDLIRRSLDWYDRHFAGHDD